MSDFPAFRDLADDDKSQVVRFLRKAEDEGVEYTDENYPPKFGMGSPLYPTDGYVLADRYRGDYAALRYGAEFWRLYELGDGR